MGDFPSEPLPSEVSCPTTVAAIVLSLPNRHLLADDLSEVGHLPRSLASEKVIDGLPHGMTKVPVGGIFEQIGLTALHDGGGQSPVVSPILKVEFTDVGVHVGQIVAYFGDENDTIVAAHDVVVHDDKQQQCAAKHPGKKLRHRTIAEEKEGHRVTGEQLIGRLRAMGKTGKNA